MLCVARSEFVRQMSLRVRRGQLRSLTTVRSYDGTVFNDLCGIVLHVWRCDMREILATLRVCVAAQSERARQTLLAFLRPAIGVWLYCLLLC